MPFLRMISSETSSLGVSWDGDQESCLAIMKEKQIPSDFVDDVAIVSVIETNILIPNFCF